MERRRKRREAEGGRPAGILARWAGVPLWKRLAMVTGLVLVMGALADGLDSGPSLAEGATPERLAVVEHCRVEAAESLGLGARERIRHSGPADTYVKDMGAGRYRVALWLEAPGEESRRARFICLIVEVRPGSGSYVLADLIAR